MQPFEELQEIAQAAHGERRLALKLGTAPRPIGIRPEPRDLQGRGVGKSHHDDRLARRQDLEILARQRMVPADDPDSRTDIVKVVLSL